MKIKSIRKTGPELYLVEYVSFFGWKKERYVINAPEDENNIIMIYYRDSSELAHFESEPIEWVIRNDVEFFDNYPEPWDEQT